MRGELGEFIEKHGGARMIVKFHRHAETESQVMHFLLFYDVAADYLERRGQFRAEHLALAWETAERGELLLAGALADPIDGAVLLFQGETPAVAEAFAARDPYVREGLVTRWRVRPWTTVVGELAATPVRISAGDLR